MIRHAAAAAFPVGPLPVAVIEPSLPALLVPPVGGSQLLPPCFPPASVAAVSVAPVTMTADPEHRATADTPAKPLAQGLFAGPHRRPSGGTGQPRLGLAGGILSTEDVRSFFGSAQKPRSLLTVGVFHFRLRPNHAPDRVSLAWRRLSIRETTIANGTHDAILGVAISATPILLVLWIINRMRHRERSFQSAVGVSLLEFVLVPSVSAGAAFLWVRSGGEFNQALGVGVVLYILGSWMFRRRIM